MTITYKIREAVFPMRIRKSMEALRHPIMSRDTPPILICGRKPMILQTLKPLIRFKKEE